MNTPTPDSRKISTGTNLISVIMPCYNSEKYLTEAIDSVFNQTYPHVELIIIDDGSTDSSRKILDGYGHRIKVLKQANRGPYPARNLGLEHASGEFVAFLDADDWWDSTFLEKMHAALVDSDAALSYCGWQNVGTKQVHTKPYIPPDYTRDDIYRNFLKSCPWPIHAALLHRWLIDETHGFSERYFTSMDYDLWLNISSLTNKINRVPEVLAFYRWHDGGQISSKAWEQASNSWRVRIDFANRNPDKIKHIPNTDLKRIYSGYLMKKGAAAFNNGDLISARKIFQKVLQEGGWKILDIKYLLPAYIFSEKLYLVIFR